VFEFPVDVCRDCLISFTGADIDPLCTVPNCLGNPSVQSDAGSLVPCMLGQDSLVDCQVCKGLGIADCNPPAQCVDAGIDQ
jgi:hypothetical protein